MSVFIVTNCPDICDRRPAPPAPAQEANEVKTTRAESRGGARGSVVRAGQQRVRQRERRGDVIRPGTELAKSYVSC